ncbi:hypothetical protein NP233_g1074 [Leucocoprinus birnbaumii]|uniref:Cytochrome P450 n=1 Tax=Leucocoprinus birnbaumii TaxID=56174 RepID=A0AAD5W0P3_9AGAR|nr:hypothetical protein NP233_g1074 [Leucocoprinus birnbaumii]
MWIQTLLALTVLYGIKKTIDFWQAIRSVGNVPGYRTLVNPNSTPVYFLPRLKGFCPGANWCFVDKYSMYSWAGLDIVAHVGVFPSQGAFYVADAAAVKEITTYRSRFPKPVEYYDTLSFFGFNIVASEGEDWKRYRKISAPAFSDRNNKLVWDETVSIMNDLFDNAWENKEEITVDHCLELTLPITLFTISAAGFGQKLSWKGGHTIPPGHKMTFKDSLYTVTTYLIARLSLPDWMMSLSKKGREIMLGFQELKMHMVEMVETRLKSEKVERDDLFTSLLNANSDELDGGGLTTDELIGNIFVFMLAGHETTAHTLCFTLALLALHPDEQEKLYRHIKSVIPDPKAPTYEEMPLLTQTMAVFNETLRMFPAVSVIPKRSAEDTTLTTTNAQGETVIVPIPKGMDVHINVPALQNNPKYWDDPHDFKPDRFLKTDWNRDAFLPFSGGPRACLGRKFAETEVIASLTMLVSRYKISVKDEPQFAKETFEQRKARLLKAVDLLSLTLILASFLPPTIMLSRAIAALVTIYVVQKIIAYRRVVQSVGNLGGYRVVFERDSLMGALLRRIPGVSTGGNHALEDKYSVHERVGCDIVAHISAFPPSVHLWMADAEAIKEVTTSRARFPKPIDRYKALLFYGGNIVASEGETWKKYRRITAPAFSDRNNKLVWDETCAIMSDLFENVWGDKKIIEVDHCRDLTLPIALFVIGVAGFGRKMTWQDDSLVPAGHKLSFQESLSIVSINVLPKLILPDWAMALTEKTRKIALAYDELKVSAVFYNWKELESIEGTNILKVYMTEMVEGRQKSERVERHDLFSALLEANSEDEEALSTEELIGNIFIFLLAGHETTAHTLCFTFALLALYPDKQEKLYQQIKSIIPNARLPTYEEMPLLTLSTAVFNETLRLYPPVQDIPKRAAEDTTLATTNAQGETVIIPVPAGTNLDIHTPALHYNPKYWEDPHAFKPERFLKSDWNRDAFLPFSAGARACMGRKFFETEGIAALTMLVSQYKITVKEEPEFAHETFEQRKERIMRSNSVLTTTPVRTPLVFTRRQ